MKFKFESAEFLSKVAASGLTFKEVARRANVAYVSIFNAAEGKPLYFQTYLKICAALNLEPNFETLKE